jgi:hypothetical protein
MRVELFRQYLGSQEFERKLNSRIERLQQAELNPVERTSVYVDIQEDPITFINLFGLVYEPRLPESPDVPFFLFPYQEEVIYKMLEAEIKGQDLLIEKTRDMGVTWTLVWYYIWRWLTKDRWYGLMGSRKEEEVDNKSPQSLFGKVRYGIYSMPKWIRPPKFKKSEHDTFMKLVNPDRMSYIDGESANPNFGRGKRTSMIYLDELFFWKFARESWRSCIDTSPCRIGVSTPKSSSFARNLRESFEEQGRLMTLDWHKHPFKDEEWYKNETKRRQDDPLGVEAELNISYLSDPEYAYYPEILNCPLRELSYSEGMPLYLGLDFGAQDKTAISYWQRDTQNFFCLDAIERKNKKLSWFYPFLKQGIDFEKQDIYEFINKFTHEKFVIDKHDYLQAERDMIKKFNSWKPPVMYCGEVAHKQKMIKSNTTIQQELAGIGIPLRIRDDGFKHKVRREATKRMLTRSIFDKNTGALDVYDALANSHYPIGRMNATSDDALDKPVHDEWADLRASVENLAVNLVLNVGAIRDIVYRKYH